MNAWSLPAIGLYAAAFWYLGAWRSIGKDDSETKTRGLLLGTAAVIVHAAAHVSTAWQQGHADLRFYAALSLVSLGMAALSTVVAWQRRFGALGQIAYPLAAISLLAFALTPVSARTHSLSWALESHALLALLAFATLAVAAIIASLLWVQEQTLRSRNLANPLLRLLPPLTELESLLFRVIAAGFVLLTVALTMGIVFVDDMLGQHLAHKTVLSTMSWLTFGALLYGRARYGWRGRTAVRLTLWAMTLLLLAFFGSKLVLELILKRTEH